MEKERWRDFLAAKLESQIALETAGSAKTWGFALLAFISLAFALSSLGSLSSDQVFASKILFLIFFHTLTLLGFCLPNLIQKGENAVGAWLGIRDFVSFVWIFMALLFYAVIAWTVSFQAASAAGEFRVSGFFGFVAWANVVFVSLYVAVCVLGLLSLLFFPQSWIKLLEKSGRFWYGLLIAHSVFSLLLAFSYSETTAIGSPEFFGQFRFISLFWIFIACSILWMSRSFQESAVPALSALELEIVSGRLERREDILARFKEAFISRRLSAWTHRLSRVAATDAHEIAQLTHEAVSLVSSEKPHETDLIKVEDRYRRAENRYKKLERENQRFLLCLMLIHLSEAERERSEAVRDQFSRELRNAKIELASVRKQIDEKLVSLKNKEPRAAAQVPVEPIPLAR